MIIEIEIHNFRVCPCWECYLNRHKNVCDRTMTPYELKGVKVNEMYVIYSITMKGE